MKKKLLVYTLLLALALTSLYGCSKTDKKNNQQQKKSADVAANENKGRYIEKTIPLPEMLATETRLMVVRNQDKQFEAYTYNEQDSTYKRYILKDDTTWETGEVAWLNTSELKGFSLASLCIGEDGNLYAVRTNYNNEGNTCKIYKSEDNGLTSTEIPLTYLNEPTYEDEEKTYYPSITKLKVLKNGTLVFSDMWKQNTLLLYSQDDKALGTVPADALQDYITSDNTIIAASENSSQIFFYDAETKKTIKTVDFNFQANGTAFSLKDDGTLLAGDSEGIHRMLPDGTLWEIPVDGSLTSLSMPSLYINSLYVGEQEPEDYYSLSSESEKDLRLSHYVFDKDASAVPKSQVTLYSLRDNATIRQAVSLFQQKNPDVRINYVVAMGNEGGNLTDYIRALNTELLAGNGADIILLDGLPAASYIEKGVLEDVSDILKPLTEDGSILPNIAESYTTDGKIYQMPIRFSIPLIVGTSDALASVSSLSTLTDYAVKSGKPFMKAYAQEAFVNDFLALYSGDFFQNNKLSESDFQNFLTNIKILSDNLGKPSKEEFDGTAGAADTLFRASSEIFALKSHKTSATLTRFNNITNSLMMFALAKEKGISYNAINNSFLPSGMIGINKAGKNIETAKAFLKFLYTEEIQSANLYDGLPVNRASLKTWTDEENDNIMLGTSDEDGNEFTALWADKKDRDKVFQLAQTVNTPLAINQQINDILKEQILAYLKGDLGLNEVMAAVKSKVNTYLSE